MKLRSAIGVAGVSRLIMIAFLSSFIPYTASCEDGAAGGASVTTAAGAVYYMAPANGDDAGPGSAEKPFASFEVALPKLKAGDTLILKKGLYQLKDMIKPKCNLVGTENAPITIKGEDGAVLKGLYDKATNKNKFGPDKYTGVAVGDSSWVVIENLEMENNGNISVGNDHITYRNCHIHDYSNYALITNGSRNLTVENCRIHGSTVEHGIYLTSDNKDVIIRNCDFSDTAINGIHINGTEDRRILVEGNRFHQVSRDWGACITLMGAREIIIRNNVFFCNMGHIITATDKKGIHASGIQIYNNTIYQTADGRKGAMLVINGSPQNWDVHHNVVFTNTAMFEGSFNNMKDAKFHDNFYGPAAGTAAKQIGDTTSTYNADLKFVKTPATGDQECDLHLKDDKLDKKYGAYAESPKEARFIPGVN